MLILCFVLHVRLMDNFYCITRSFFMFANTLGYLYIIVYSVNKVERFMWEHARGKMPRTFLGSQVIGRFSARGGRLRGGGVMSQDIGYYQYSL